MSDGPLVPDVRRRRRDGEGVMTTVEADGVMLGVEHFGDVAAPLVLLTGGTTMLSWPDTLCEALARGGRHVVRYDLRDSGASTTVDPQAPAYTLRDLAADAAALARDLDDRPAHLAGIGVGGMVAQIAALDHPEGVVGCGSGIADALNRISRVLPTVMRQQRWICRQPPLRHRLRPGQPHQRGAPARRGGSS